MANKTQPTTPEPRIALVCDWLTTPGGAEKVLLELHHLYPDAPIYTSQYSKKGISWFNDADVRTGWLQIFPKSFRKVLGPLRQIYFSHLDLSAYDLVISVTGAEAKAVKTVRTPKDTKQPLKKPSQHPESPKKNTLSSHYSTDDVKSQYHKAHHLCYCHVPTQYYWQMYDKYVENPGFGFLNPLVRLAFKLLVKPLRQADFESAQRPDQFITISRYAAAQIKQYYHRDAVIIAPPVDVNAFSRHPETTTLNNRSSEQDLSTKTMNLSTKKSALIHQDPAHYPQETYTIPQVIHQKSTENPKISTKESQLSTSFPQKGINLSTAGSNLSTSSPQDNGQLPTGFPQDITNLSTETHNFSTTFPQKQPDFSTGNQDFSTEKTPKSPPNETAQTPSPVELSLASNYYIIACRQVTWKRVDLAISACQELNLPLKVVGDGPEHHRLVQLAASAPNIEFIPWVETSKLADLLHHAKAYIFPSLEPFGIAAVEALAAGCPVVAYREGGSQDFINTENGIFFDEQTTASLVKALRQAEAHTFYPEAIAQTATQFSADHFRSAIKNLVTKTLQDPISQPKLTRPENTERKPNSSTPQKPTSHSNHPHSNNSPHSTLASKNLPSKSIHPTPKEPAPNPKKTTPKSNLLHQVKPSNSHQTNAQKGN